MFNDAASATASSPLHNTGAFLAWAQGLSSLFQTTRPGERTGIVHRAWLFAFVAAGAAVRFWGLGNVGLHGDEETMALAVRHILIDGDPILPSGMFYPRGMTQLYLMAASVWLFGESEWALRLPSVLAGVALIPAAYFAGRRFLRPEWSLALAGVAAFLPALISDSQTARMYIFLMTYVTCSMACLFRWESTQRIGWLLASAAFLVIGLDMQMLAVGAVLMLLLPGALHGDVRQLRNGALAAGFVVVAFVVMNAWVEGHYPSNPPPEFLKDFGEPPTPGSIVPRDFNLAFDLVLWATGVVMSALAMHVVRAMPGRASQIAVTTLLFAGIVLQLAVYYHLAALAYLAGVALALRNGAPKVRGRLIILALAAGLLLLVHCALLMSASGAFVKLVGALVGQPSVWPYARIAQTSPLAGVLTGGLIGWGLYLFVQRRRAPDYFLLAILGVWAPVFALGMFAWNVPPRYTSMALMPMLVCALALAQHLFDRVLAWLQRTPSNAVASALTAGVIGLGIVDPAASLASMNMDYDGRPDHKGAAEFMKTQGIIDEDIVIAEDVLQQTYYLGRVDYWLIGPKVARRFIERTDAGVVDIYTGTPVIVTKRNLEQLLRENEGKRIFVIGTGEGWRGDTRSVREDMHALLESDSFDSIYTGRDGLTRVLRAAPSGLEQTAATSPVKTKPKSSTSASASPAKMNAAAAVE